MFVEEPVEKLVDAAQRKLGGGALLSAVATRAVELSSQADASIHELSDVVQCDPGLSMQIIRIANSPLYAPRKPIDALDRAIMMLGLRECQSVILASGIARMMRNVPLEEDWLRNYLCEHALMCGVACRRLNQYFNLQLHGSEFAAGLLHDIGYVVIGSVHPEWLGRSEAMELDEPPTLLDTERQAWGVDHAAVGAAFAAAADLPARLVDTTRHHHQFERGRDPRLTALVALGDAIAIFLQRKEDIATFPFGEQSSLAFLAQAANLHAEQLHPTQLASCLRQVSADTARMFKAMF